MKNANELRNELSMAFAGLMDGTLKPSQASELANIAGKMISSAKVQVDYYSLRGEKPSIAFLTSSDPDASAEQRQGAEK